SWLMLRLDMVRGIETWEPYSKAPASLCCLGPTHKTECADGVKGFAASPGGDHCLGLAFRGDQGWSAGHTAAAAGRLAFFTGGVSRDFLHASSTGAVALVAGLRPDPFAGPVCLLVLCHGGGYAGGVGVAGITGAGILYAAVRRIVSGLAVTEGYVVRFAAGCRRVGADWPARRRGHDPGGLSADVVRSVDVALGNVVTRHIGRVDILGLVIWGAL